MSILTVNNVVFKYPQAKKRALDNVSFGIEKGSYTAIVGSNGSGKSTLARIICGLENCESGSVLIEENCRLGIVFQSPKEQLVSSLVARDTAFGPQNLGLKNGEVELRTIECLNITDMLHKAHSSTNALSLGQTQKIAISGMLAIHPDILILDEAVSMLDPESREEIFEFLRYWHKSGNTIIHITHDLEAVKEAQNVIAMERGQTFFYGTSKAFLENPDYLFKITGKALDIEDRLAYKKSIEEGKRKKSLKFSNVCFSYDGKSGVENINFTLHKSSLIALTGASGAGKSTILELAAGLINPQKGKILFLKEDEKNHSDAELKKNRCKFSVLAQQNTQAALFERFASDDVAFGPRNLGIKSKELVELVRKSMDKAGLPFDEFGERFTFGLSGGEQRRLSIAGILAMDSDIFLFDEPSAGLDSQSREKVLLMMKNLALEGKTVLFTSHKRDEADFAHREIKVQNGKLVFDSLHNIENPFITEKNEFDSNRENNKSLEKENLQLSEVLSYDTEKLLGTLRNMSASLSGMKVNKTSFIQKLAPVVRIIIFLLLFIASLGFGKLFTSFIAFLLSLIYAKLSGLSFKAVFKAFIKIFPFLLFICVLQLIFHPALEGEILFTNWKWFTVSPSKLLYCLGVILRTDASLAILSGFFISTPEHDLIDGLKILLRPLEIIKLPVRYLILIIEVIFRFIPLLIDETMCIIKTQTMRGGMGKVKGKMARLKALIPLFVPIIIQTVKRSEALADAITMRCFK